MTLEPLSLERLAIAFVPALLVIALMWRQQMNYNKAIYGLLRMLIQLLLIGYALIYIFEAESSLIILLVLLVMVTASSWISLNTLQPEQRRSLVASASFALLLGGGLTLALITQGVLQLDPWYQPRYMIPLAGMVFANAMTSLSLAAERYFAELEHGHDADKARQLAYQAAMIPVINALFAVGLVSLPGMMTGQILSGVSPFIAARYQIMVMCMIFGSAGLSTALFLYSTKRFKHTATDKQPPEPPTNGHKKGEP